VDSDSYAQMRYSGGLEGICAVASLVTFFRVSARGGTNEGYVGTIVRKI